MIEVLFVVFFMFVWFDTDALVDYGRALRLTRYLKIDKWDEWREKYPRAGYLDFMMTRYRGFFTKLAACRSCISFWVSAIACHFGIGVHWTPAVYLCSLLSYNIYVWLLWKLRRF